MKFKSVKNDLGICFIKRGKGQQLKNDDQCFIKFSLFHKSDTGFLKSISLNDKKNFILGSGEVLPGWDLGLTYLKIGDSAVIKIPPALAYGNKKVGSIFPNSYLFLCVKVDSARKIFFSSSKNDTIRFASGLKKIIHFKGKGNKVNPEDEVKLSFTGYVYSSTGKKQIFESSKTNSSEAVFQVGIGKFVTGLDEGLSTMFVGEKSTFIVPPELGYGNEKVGKILPNTTLYYDIELIKSEFPFLSPAPIPGILFSDSTQLNWSIKKSTSDTIRKSDVVSYHYKQYYLNADSKRVEYDNSYKRSKVKMVRPGSGVSFPGIEQSILHMKKGEKATVKVPYSANFMRKKLLFLPIDAPVFIDIEIMDVNEYPFIKFNKVDTVKLNEGLKIICSEKVPGIDSVGIGYSVNIAFTVFYEDSKKNKNIIDCSRDNGRKLYMFTVGEGKTIPGVEAGIIGMKPGETRRLIIPPKLAYGENGLPEKGLPAGTNLIFDIEFLEILKPAKS
ncbi:MAG: FKBP-type peptidyl-prolyl cis-trans isomerase [Bacteroidota bacterium]